MSWLAALLLILALVAGCTASPTAPGPTSAGPTTAGPTGTARGSALLLAQQAADAIGGAVLSADRDTFTRWLSRADPGFTPTAAMLYDNLTGLGLLSFDITLTGQQRPLSARRQQLLGGGAWVAEALVDWRLQGDRSPAEHIVWLTFRGEQGRQLLAGSTDGDRTTAQPLWCCEPVHAARRGHATVIGSTGVALGPWLARADRAALAVARQLGGTPRLVIEVPGSQRALERMVAATPGSYRQIAALTWPDGTKAASAPLRIIVNPAQSDRLGELAVAVLLAHEATHVILASPSSPSPLWVVEGYADFVAYRAYPQASHAAAAGFLADTRSHGAPRALPGDEQFSPQAQDLDLSYAEAWFAVSYLAHLTSPAVARDFYDQLQRRYGGDLSRAMPALLGVSLADFTSGWRRYVQHQAAGR
ncbi:hypothetical protein GCM10009841_16000 [Microlunatus panaciterrae]|uniref:Peptidase MA superfamily protein n=1 Tax=Microlunatus panaciterrae TaxID=400768 RepID=A0ABS2RMC0_9ACTN|nr:hypothetical protein [Microlunatus panaciterrae]MBM7800158.1 hypothetical protein [Microlunatus panaciterrae]